MKTTQGTQNAYSVRVLYGSSTDMAVGAMVKLRNCPTLLCKAVPRDVKYLQLICSKLTSTRGLDKAAMVYRGQSGGAVCEQMRILLSRIHRRHWTPAEREREHQGKLRGPLLHVLNSPGIAFRSGSRPGHI